MGQRGSQMTNVMNRFGRSRGLEMFADWSDRIAAGAVPPRPPRPAGVERNVVVTMWEWGNEIDYIHDEIATDKRNPTVNANGPIYGVNISNDELTMLDPVTHEATSLPVPLRADPATVAPMIARSMPVPSRFFGDELIWNDPPIPQPDDGRAGAGVADVGHPAAAQSRLVQGGVRQPLRALLPDRARLPGRRLLRPADGVVRDDRHLLRHPPPAVRRGRRPPLFFSGGGAVVGWLETAVYDETGDEQASQGWCPTVIDTNGDGVITQPWNEPNRRGQIDAFDPSRDTRLVVGSYGIVPDPLNDTGVWVVSNRFPGRLAYMDIGDNPPETCLTEVYEVPSALDPNVPREATGFGPRGLDIDRHGVVWTALSGSSHFASFDRSKCEVRSGPDVLDGRHCVDGWTLYPTPGPVIPGTDPPMRADYHYYKVVDPLALIPGKSPYSLVAMVVRRTPRAALTA